MMREKYESLPLATLKDLAKARGLKGISTMKKAELIERMLEEDEKEKKSARETVKELFLKLCRMVMDLSEVLIICRGKTMSMYLRLRSEDLI